MFKQLQAIIQPRVVRVKLLDKRIRVLHHRVAKEIKEGVKESFKVYVPKDGNTHHTPFTK